MAARFDKVAFPSGWSEACVVGVIKISVESVAESIMSKYNIHNSKIQSVDDITVEHEMMIGKQYGYSFQYSEHI